MSNQWKAAAIAIGMLLAFAGSAMFVAEIGISETFDVIQGDDGNVTNTTSIALGNTGGGVDLIDRLLVVTMVVSLLVYAGVVTAARGNPELVNKYIAFFPLIGLAIGVTEYIDQVGDILSGDYIWANHSDLTNAIHAACVGWILVGTAKLMK